VLLREVGLHGHDLVLGLLDQPHLAVHGALFLGRVAPIGRLELLVLALHGLLVARDRRGAAVEFGHGHLKHAEDALR